MTPRTVEFTEADLKEATDPRSWQRGVNYHAGGNVYSLLENAETVVAKVRGTRNYRVTLWTEDGELEGECTCPMGDAGVFCKHCVAAGLAYLEGQAEEATGPREPPLSLDDLRKYLTKQNKSALVEIIMQQAVEDDRLRESLLLKAALRGGDQLNVATFRQAIDEVTDTWEFVDYRSAHEFARDVDQVVDQLAALLDAGHAAELVDLAEYAIARCEGAWAQMDDSDGYMGAILERLGELHHAACAATRPDPEDLARRLFQHELGGSSGAFYGAVRAYTDVLGDKGLAEYRRLAQEAWDKLSPLGPGEREARHDGNRFRLTSIMEALARAEGDVEALVAIKSRDLSSSYRYLEIAQVYQEHGQRDEALKWAEDGLRKFPEGADDRLREFAANEYHRRRRHDEAMELVWASFAGRPSLAQYKSLKGHADRAHDWPKWRRRALETVHKNAGEARKRARQERRSWGHDTDHSVLVEIHLWEKDVNSAWAEAQAGGCSDHLWLELAQRREKDHPADALDVYQARVEPIIRQTNNEAYRAATAMIRKIRQLMKRLDRSGEFDDYLASIRTAYKRKRNFIAMLNRMK